ncbi:MAG: hypothetical protein QG577_1223 [Thermodesulfobacteriota bacterium]|nr:hypothetical protein [Thermodesulfobacteriota bacterium]
MSRTLIVRNNRCCEWGKPFTLEVSPLELCMCNSLSNNTLSSKTLHAKLIVV